ncbi:epoxide hydrolase, soluble [Suhomyces tanzawaensis NRRL Y-17324]|uniref:Epoxide hydrolase, soluble n=1 Tax=Suhomyces tanzawaensis NRRL Y-17324 TaxID=984487 RepID=A0A1E4SMV9_9ASCO|nr:epoxide hydrolase, soluble [Suhomyces tanzawaensis NRRL Y-17324]ODV80722.1 epoxide hydrolase, soluble [Suhomyces tanzawaensis NRRL Y-17324]
MPHEIILENGPLAFTTLSNHSAADVFTTTSRKWNRVVLLLHGFPDDHTTFQPIWQKLLDAFDGSKVLLLAPKMRGYERSSQPSPPAYSLKDIAGDVRSWIISLNASSVPVHIIGHDWGAVVSYETATLYPDLVSSMACLAIPFVRGIKPWTLVGAAPSQLWLSSYMVRMQLPLFYLSRLQETGDDSYLDYLWKTWSPTWKYSKNDIARLKAAFADEKVVHSTTAYYRGIADPRNVKQLRFDINFQKVPTLVLGGQVDGCMSRGLFDVSRQHFAHIPNLRIEVVPGVGHFMHREDPEAISGLLIEWFQKHQTPN